jgi:hypothetical protein
MGLSKIGSPWVSPNLPAIPEPPPPPIFNPEGLIGCSFLMDEQEDGQRFRGRIVELIEDPRRWKIIPPGSSPEFLSLRIRLKKSSLTTKCYNLSQ